MDYKTHWWRIDIFIITNNPYLIFTLFPRMKHLFKQNGQNLIYPKKNELNEYQYKLQQNQVTSNPISSLIQSIHLSTIIPVLYHSSNEMRSLHASSRIAEIQTNNQSFSSCPTVSIPPCKPKAASLNQFSVCRWALASRWIIPSKQATENPKHFLPFFLVVWFPVWNTRIQHSHSHYYTSYPLPIPYTPKSNEKLIVTFTLCLFQTNSLFSLSSQNTFHSIPFLSNNHTQYSKNTMETLLDIFLFHSLQCLVQFSSVTSWHGFCFTITLMGSLSVLGCVFYASPQIQSWILCVASELRSDRFSLCEPPL